MLQWLSENYGEIIQAVLMILSGVSIIVKLTPTPKDDAVLAKILVFFSFLKPKGVQGTVKMPFTSVKK